MMNCARSSQRGPRNSRPGSPRCHMNNVAAALEEIDRAVSLGARGIQIFTNVAGRPLDDPEFLPLFEEAVRRGLAVWMHPAARRALRRLPGREKNRNTRSGRCWAGPTKRVSRWRAWCFPASSTGLPGLKIVTHHLGAHDPLFRRPRRAALGPARQPHLGRGLRADPRRDAGEGPPSDRLFPPLPQRHRGRRLARRRSAAASISSAPTMCSSRPTARSTPRAGRCSSARRSPRSTGSGLMTRNAQRSIPGTRSPC